MPLIVKFVFLLFLKIFFGAFSRPLLTDIGVSVKGGEDGGERHVVYEVGIGT